MELNILYEDQELLVCVKPPGIAVQSARVGAMDMESMLRNYLARSGSGASVPCREQSVSSGASASCREQPASSGASVPCREQPVSSGASAPYLGVVHRLDQPVRGVMVFAKSQRSAASLSAQAADGRMKKIYQAIVEGNPPAEEGHLTDWLLKDGRTNASRIVPAGTKGAKRAELKYRVLERFEDQAGQEEQATEQGESRVRAQVEEQGNHRVRARVEVELLTGRHHQIRVQMAGAGMPLLGDRKYGRAAGSERGGCAGIPDHVALCAVSLTFRHPKTGKEMTFQLDPNII